MKQPTNYNSYVVWDSKVNRPSILNSAASAIRFTNRKEATAYYQSTIADPATVTATFTIVFANGVERTTGRFFNHNA
jgi:hypothetical protein